MLYVLISNRHVFIAIGDATKREFDIETDCVILGQKFLKKCDDNGSEKYIFIRLSSLHSTCFMIRK